MCLLPERNILLHQGVFDLPICLYLDILLRKKIGSLDPYVDPRQLLPILLHFVHLGAEPDDFCEATGCQN
jgi:hypothetical protein